MTITNTNITRVFGVRFEHLCESEIQLTCDGCGKPTYKYFTISIESLETTTPEGYRHSWPGYFTLRLRPYDHREHGKYLVCSRTCGEEIKNKFSNCDASTF